MNSALVNSHLCITQVNSAPLWSPSRVGHLISFGIMHSGRSVHVPLAFMFKLIPGISSSQFSLYLCLDSQSTITNWGPGFYRTIMFYWYTWRWKHCILFNRVAMSFLKITISGFVICNHINPMGKAVVVEDFHLMQYGQSFSITLL